MNDSTPFKTKRPLWLGTAGAALALAAASAMASNYPSKPIELIVQFPADSSADVVARVLADGMSKHVGQNVIVVNRPGAGGALACKHVQAAKPGGYTLVFNSNSISTVHYSGLTKFDYKALDPIARVTIENPVLAVRKDSSWNNLSDMMTHARAKPGEKNAFLPVCQPAREFAQSIATDDAARAQLMAKVGLKLQ